MTTVKTYDQRSYDLAEYFLADLPDLNNERAKHSLALNIQQCVEDEIYFMRQGIFDDGRAKDVQALVESDTGTVPLK